MPWTTKGRYYNKRHKIKLWSKFQLGRVVTAHGGWRVRIKDNCGHDIVTLSKLERRTDAELEALRQFYEKTEGHIPNYS